jgi:hypothetical protein
LDLDLGSLEAGAGKEIVYSVRPSVPGRLEGRGTVISAEGARAEANTVTQVRAPVLEIECTAPASAPAGRPAETGLTVRNAGDAPEERVSVALSIPGGARVESVTDGGRIGAGSVLWELGTLDPGASRRVCASLVGANPAQWDLAVEARGACAETRRGVGRMTVAGVAGVLLEVVDIEDPVEVGQLVTYRIKVRNQGSADLTHIRLRCTPHSSQEFASAAGPTAIAAEGGVLRSAPLPRLEPKTDAEWQVVVRAVRAADARFKVELTAEQHPESVAEDEATEQY